MNNAVVVLVVTQEEMTEISFPNVLMYASISKGFNAFDVIINKKSKTTLNPETIVYSKFPTGKNTNSNLAMIKSSITEGLLDSTEYYTVKEKELASRSQGKVKAIISIPTEETIMTSTRDINMNKLSDKYNALDLKDGKYKGNEQNARLLDLDTRYHRSDAYLKDEFESEYNFRILVVSCDDINKINHQELDTYKGTLLTRLSKLKENYNEMMNSTRSNHNPNKAMKTMKPQLKFVGRYTHEKNKGILGLILDKLKISPNFSSNSAPAAPAEPAAPVSAAEKSVEGGRKKSRRFKHRKNRSKKIRNQ